MNKRHWLGVVGLVVVLFSLCWPAFAQVPGPLVPGRQNAEPLEKPKATPPNAIPKSLINVQAVPENGADITFVLKDIRLIGNDAISTADLKSLWAPYRGRKIDITQIYQVANNITRYYADRGYALSFAFVPEQEITDNTPIIRVVEGYVSKIIFKNGNQTIQPPATIATLVAHIQQSIPLKSADLERYMLLLNDQPGYVGQATFIPSQAENASDLVIQLDQQKFQTSAGIDNHLAKTLGRLQARAAVSVNSVVTDTDVLQFQQGCGAFCDVYSAYDLQWGTALNSEGTRINFEGSQATETPTEGVLVPLDFHGKSQNFAVRISHPVLRSRQTNLEVGSTLGWADSYTKTFAGVLTRDRIRTVNAYGQYDHADWTGGINQVRLNINKGLPIFQASTNADTLRSRSGGSAEFVIANLSASRYQPLDTIWPTLHDVSMIAKANVQQALTDPLLSISQCYYGGDDFGRGYESGALSGDSCGMASLEMRRNFYLDERVLQLFAYGDGGIVDRRGALPPGEKRSEAATSIGIGARLFVTSHFQSEFQVGWPLNEEATSSGKTAPRGLLSMSVRF